MKLRLFQAGDRMQILPWIADFYSFHRALVQPTADCQPDLEKTEASLTEWLQLGSVLVVEEAQLLVGFPMCASAAITQPGWRTCT